MAMKPILYQWHIGPAVIILTLVLFCLYFLGSGFKRHRGRWCFWLAIFLLLFVECAPLDYLGGRAYLSAHMVSHIILLLLCGPLFVLSIPSKPAFRLLKPLLMLSAFISRHNWFAWITGVGVMWFWHIPAVFQSAMGRYPLLNSCSLLLAGMIFSWPLFGPVKSDRIHSVTGIVYLFTACISCSVLGLLIAFSPPGTYGHYPETDKKAAGLIMWVPCCFVYLTGCLYLLFRWFAEKAGHIADEFSKLNDALKEHEDDQTN